MLTTKQRWKLNNLQRERENNKRWYEANKDAVSKRKADLYAKDPDKEKLRSRVFYKKNPLKKRPKTTQAKLVANIRSKVSHIVSGRYKKSSTEKYIGCSFKELKLHIESQFTENMSWDNYGLYGWHVDHIRPLSSFDLSVESNLHLAWHFTNLRPLWAKDNLQKGKKYVHEI